MGIEEFDELEGAQNEPGRAEGLDEDLFDFPVSVQPTVPSTPSPAGDAHDPIPPALPNTDVRASVTPSGPAPSSPEHPAYDPELDEDLFNFSQIFSGSDVVAPVPMDEPSPLESAEFTLPETSDPDPEPTTSTEAADDHVPVTSAPSAPPAADLVPQQPPPPIPEAPAQPKGRLVELLVIAFLLVNTGIIVLAWQASSSFQDTLSEVTRTVADTISRQPSSAGPPITYVPFPVEEESTPSNDQDPSELEDLQVQSVGIARRLIEEGQYMDARRRLYLLLANQDLTSLDERLVTETEYLIAETYERQAQTLQEVR